MSSISTSQSTTLQQEDISVLARKMKRIQQMLSSLKEDEDEEMVHLQQLIDKGRQVEERVKSRIDQCDLLKGFIKAPSPKHAVDENGRLFVKGHSLESKRKENMDLKPQVQRVKGHGSPEIPIRRHKNSEDRNHNEEKAKSRQKAKKENRLNKLANIIDSSLEGLKSKDLKHTDKQTHYIPFQDSPSKKASNSRVSHHKPDPNPNPVTSTYNPVTSTPNPTQSPTITQQSNLSRNMAIFLTLGLLLCLLRYL